ncbi:MAG: sugar phosphate isomerase/epimerase [Clostridiales bacterium]|nr:MAG: sugar phosphate isomerase/epimerase [Clostridiales bacterium]
MDIIAENSHPNFKFTLDVYWVAFCGINPVKCLEKYKNKIECIHFKDLGVDTNEGKMVNPIVMRAVSEGNLDWDEIIAASDESGCKMGAGRTGQMLRRGPVRLYETKLRIS